MFKKLISLLCTVAILMGLLPALSVPSRAAEVGFQVGYARVDVNPYVVEDDPTSGIMPLPLRGTGDVWNRLSTQGLVDDNGDGVVDQNDGLKATCISVTDGDGKTILLITIDLAGSGLVTQVRPAVVKRVNEAIASGELTGLQELTEEQIYYSATHTHNAPDAEAYVSAGKTGTNDDGVDLSVVNENLGIWIDRTIVDIGNAAILALKDRETATLTKDRLAVDDATSPVLHDKELAGTRHYKTEVDGSEFICGDGFNSVTKSDYADPSDYRTARGVNPKQITQVDDTMYLLRFDFPQGGKLPVILTSWKGHPSLNNNDDFQNSGIHALSSDYVNAYRHGLEYGCDISYNSANGYLTGWTLGTEQKYRVAFFQGSGGNVNTKNYEKVTYAGTDGNVTQYGNYWIVGSAKSAEIEGYACSYGMALSRLADEAITDGLNETPVRPGRIKTMHSIYYAAGKTTGRSELAYKAAVACRAEAAVKNVTYPYKYVDSDTGETFLIGSRFHASNLVSYWNTTLNAPKTVTTKIELGVFTLGEDLAFVAVPGEPFDFYYRDTTLTGDAKFADSNNLWNDLIDEDGYGKPFILGYTNGSVGYFPNDEAYIYNQDTTNRVVGSYETHNSKLERGTGETMVRIYQQMLNGLTTSGDMNYTGFCAYCGENQLWQPYNGQTSLTTGHYYLCSDVHTNQIKISGGQTVCIDLNGFTMNGESRAIYTSDSTRDVLNIMDSSEAQTGCIRGCGATYGAALGFGGGTVLISAGDELNLYSGTMTMYDRTAYSVSAGGVLRILGTFNMHGGRILGGTACSFTGSYLSGSTVKKAQ